MYDILNLPSILLNKEKNNFDNLEPGFTTEIQILTFSVPENEDSIYIIYASSTGKVVKEKVYLNKDIN